MKNFLILIFLLLQTSTQASVQVTLLHSDGTPVSGLRLSLVVFEYGESITPIPVGECVTGATGECAFAVDDPPQVDGWTEGYLYIEGMSQPQYLGWRGETYTVTLTLLPDETLPTREPPLHGDFEHQDEWVTPTAPAPPFTAPAVTRSPSPSASPYPSSLPTNTVVVVTAPVVTPSPAGTGTGSGHSIPAWWTWGIVLASLVWFVWSVRRGRQGQ